MAQSWPKLIHLSTIARFPPGYFLENLAMRRDRSILVTVLNRRELWYVAPSDGPDAVEPAKLQTFPLTVTGICEIQPDVFLIAVGDFYGKPDCHLYRLDLNGWTAGQPIESKAVFAFPAEAQALNGMCALAPGVLLVADSFAERIWRVDWTPDGTYSARTWLSDVSMGYFPGAMKPEQPGVNGVRFAERTGYLYYTATAKRLLMRVHVNPWTHEAESKPELVTAGLMADDFCIDEDHGCLFVTTHRQNTIECVSMDPAINSDFPVRIVGDPFDARLIGPSAIVWGNRDDEYGRVAFALTDGGTASPVNGKPEDARLLRLTVAYDASDDQR